MISNEAYGRKPGIKRSKSPPSPPPRATGLQGTPALPQFVRSLLPAYVPEADQGTSVP
jgi:hypothetical protein